MVVVGMGLLILAYTAGFYGYCLIRGYDITPKQLFSTTWPPVSAATSAPTAGGVAGSIGSGIGNVAKTGSSAK